MAEQSAYDKIIQRVFLAHYESGAEELPFDRAELADVAEELGLALPKNLGDIIYSYRYRRELPEAVRDRAPQGKKWIIRPAGIGKYCFAAVKVVDIVPNQALVQTKVPDATPGIISMYALNDEQALLAKLRYNRLLDVFTGVACYSLQNHLRTAITGIGQVETDEIYVGLSRSGAHYVFPVQAKGERERISVVQIEQDFAMCQSKFPELICCPIAAQFMENGQIALFALEETAEGIRIAGEMHYLLVPPDQLSTEELEAYRLRKSNGDLDL
jgi:hypothetical protein